MAEREQQPQEEQEELHRVFRNKPLDLLAALHCRVRVKSVRGVKSEGGLLAVDPVTDTAVLVGLGDKQLDKEPASLDSHDVTLVPFVSWNSLEILDSSEVVKTYLAALEKCEEDRKTNICAEEASEAREKATELLTKHGLNPIRQGEDLVIADTVIVEPPYTAASCQATNEIILSRVRGILSGATHNLK